MDHSLEESLSLEGMDFDHSEDVVNQEDIPLEEHDRLGSITMDMGHTVEQPLLMEAGNEEVIVSDLIEDPFPFQEYTIQNDSASSSHITIDPNQVNQYNIQNESAISFQYADNLVKAPASTSNVVTIKKTVKKPVASAPRQVAIAPKPATKPVQFAIAPKPITLVANKTAAANIKKVPISGDSRNKGGTVLAHIGKQLVMMPKKIKLLPSTSSESGVQYVLPSEQVQLVGTKGNKPMYKFIQLPAQSKPDQTDQPTVISKLVPTTSPKAKYVMQQKTVPISIGQNMVVQNFKVAGKKQQMIAIKPQDTKIVAASQGNVATKQVVITSNPNQRVLYRTSAPTSSSTVVKDVISTGQRTQFHPINVPGKGIQYIKLVTNQPAQKQGTKAVPSKNFIFTDSKGNVIKMTAEKVRSNKPPPLVVSTAGSKGVVTKPQKKLVRIAPVPKNVQAMSQPARSSQSLLAPFATLTAVSEAKRTPAPAPIPAITTIAPVTSDAHEVTETAVSLEEFNEMVEQNNLSNYAETSEYQDSPVAEETVEEVVAMDQYVDVKPTLQSLYSEPATLENVPVAEQEMDIMHEVEAEIDIKQDIRNASFMIKNDSMDDTSNTSMVNTEESVIIVPGTYADKQNETMYSDDSQSQQNMEESYVPPYLSVEAECVPYNMSTSPTPSDQELHLGMRPRKACNCTKSQCLKLYCDCFANGEFCNKCNCNNCHNNLENEELRQKAIRSCLERNPNAFRPKIGKSKAGGPEIIRRHTKGCNCKRSGCLKNYCECYEAKIACTNMCKCVGCRNVEETLVRRRNAMRLREKLVDPAYRPAPPEGPGKQPCSFMTSEVIEAVCQCLIASAGERNDSREGTDPVQDVIEEFARCLQDVISASHHTL